MRGGDKEMADCVFFKGSKMSWREKRESEEDECLSEEDVCLIRFQTRKPIEFNVCTCKWVYFIYFDICLIKGSKISRIQM